MIDALKTIGLVILGVLLLAGFGLFILSQIGHV